MADDEHLPPFPAPAPAPAPPDRATRLFADLEGRDGSALPGCAPALASTGVDDDTPWWGEDGDPGTPLPEIGRTVETTAEALELLLALVGPERSGPPALWFVLLDRQDQVLPLVLPLADLPTVADRTTAFNLVDVLASILREDAPGGSVVVAYVRRGGGDRGAFESGWSGLLHEYADRLGVRVRAEVAIGRDRARVLIPTG